MCLKAALIHSESRSVCFIIVFLSEKNRSVCLPHLFLNGSVSSIIDPLFVHVWPWTFLFNEIEIGVIFESRFVSQRVCYGGQSFLGIVFVNDRVAVYIVGIVVILMRNFARWVVSIMDFFE